MKYDIENYDPKYMEEYMKAGRRERALAFRDVMISLKKFFTNTSQSNGAAPLGRPSTSNAC